MKITTAVIPAAGLGTRFLPITKAVPKELLPIGTQPAIQLVVEEAVAAALTNIIFITSTNKQSIEAYFEPAADLEARVTSWDLQAKLAHLATLTQQAHFSSLVQPEPLGLGHAVWTARHTINDYFGVLLPDDIIATQQPTIGEMAAIARREQASIIAVQEVPTEQLHSYGVVAVSEQLDANLWNITSLIEKPAPHEAPSNLAIIGRYILSQRIFPALESISNYATKELQLTDGIAAMIQRGERVLAYRVTGPRYDVGNPFGWLTANIAATLRHPHDGPRLQEWFNLHGSTPSARAFIDKDKLNL